MIRKFKLNGEWVTADVPDGLSDREVRDVLVRNYPEDAIQDIHSPSELDRMAQSLQKDSHVEPMTSGEGAGKLVEFLGNFMAPEAKIPSALYQGALQGSSQFSKSQEAGDPTRKSIEKALMGGLAGAGTDLAMGKLMSIPAVQKGVGTALSKVSNIPAGAYESVINRLGQKGKSFDKTIAPSIKDVGTRISESFLKNKKGLEEAKAIKEAADLAQADEAANAIYGTLEKEIGGRAGDVRGARRNLVEQANFENELGMTTPESEKMPVGDLLDVIKNKMGQLSVKSESHSVSGASPADYKILEEISRDLGHGHVIPAQAATIIKKADEPIPYGSILEGPPPKVAPEVTEALLNVRQKLSNRLEDQPIAEDLLNANTNFSRLQKLKEKLPGKGSNPELYNLSKDFLSGSGRPSHHAALLDVIKELNLNPEELLSKSQLPAKAQLFEGLSKGTYPLDKIQQGTSFAKEVYRHTPEESALMKFLESEMNINPNKYPLKEEAKALAEKELFNKWSYSPEEYGDEIPKIGMMARAAGATIGSPKVHKKLLQGTRMLSPYISGEAAANSGIDENENLNSLLDFILSNRR